MIIPESELELYLGNDLEALKTAWKRGLKNENMLRIVAFDKITTREYLLPVVDYFLLAHHIGNIGVRELAKQAGISSAMIKQVFTLYNLPRLSLHEYYNR